MTFQPCLGRRRIVAIINANLIDLDIAVEVDLPPLEVAVLGVRAGGRAPGAAAVVTVIGSVATVVIFATLVVSIDASHYSDRAHTPSRRGRHTRPVYTMQVITNARLSK